MKVYVLCWGNMGEGFIEGVFSTQEKADTLHETFPNPIQLFVYEYTVDERAVEGETPAND
jgi:hypothetical protein